MNYQEIKFAGKKAIELQTKIFSIVIITECGPRIAFWGKPKGENLLFWDEKNLGRGDWKLMGGHRVWVTRPSADESEEAYRSDNQPCEIQNNNNSLTITGAKDPLLQTCRGMRLEIIDDSKICIDNFITNSGDMLYSGGVWSLTCTNPNPKRRYTIPLGDGSGWDCFKLVVFRKWGGGHTSPINDSQITFTEDMLIVNPQGIETKRMIEAPYGIIAMDVPDQQTTFIKKVKYERGANYPMGCNIAFYIGPKNFMVEMETMSPEVTLKQNESVHSIENWALTDKSFGAENIKNYLNVF